jgi:predicted transcriptional regulator
MAKLITIRVSDDVYKELQRLSAIAKLDGVAQLINSALRFYNWAIKHEMKGHKIMAEKKHSYEIVELIGD